MMFNAKKPFSLQLEPDAFRLATEQEKEYISRMRPSSTFFRDGVRRLLKNKVATVSFILIVLITLASIIIPYLWPYSYDQMLGIQPGRQAQLSCFLCRGRAPARDQIRPPGRKAVLFRRMRQRQRQNPEAWLRPQKRQNRLLVFLYGKGAGGIQKKAARAQKPGRL